MNQEPLRLPKIEIVAPNVTKLYLPGGLTLYFSYEECVGFRSNDERVFSSEFHSKTTSKHMTAHFQSEKKERVAPEIFAEKLEKEFDKLFKIA
jgi:hypothetical protein